MTREEAIKRIQDFIGWFKKDSDVYEALDMAISALKQEPCEDAVSRDAVLNAIDKWHENNNQLLVNDSIEDLIIDVTYLPSVTQKSGKWIGLYVGNGEVKYECSVCGFIASGKWKYCCECGSRMENNNE